MLFGEIPASLRFNEKGYMLVHCNEPAFHVVYIEIDPEVAIRFGMARYRFVHPPKHQAPIVENNGLRLSIARESCILKFYKLVFQIICCGC